MKHLLWMFLLAASGFAADKPEPHFFDKSGNPCTVAKWIEEIKSGTGIKLETAISVGGVKYQIETRYSGLDIRDPVLNKDGKLVLIDSKTEEETPFTPMIYETIVTGPEKTDYYDGFIEKFEYQIDAKAKNDDVKAKIIAGAVVDDLATEAEAIAP